CRSRTSEWGILQRQQCSDSGATRGARVRTLLPEARIAVGGGGREIKEAHVLAGWSNSSRQLVVSFCRSRNRIHGASAHDAPDRDGWHRSGEPLDVSSCSIGTSRRESR